LDQVCDEFQVFFNNLFNIPLLQVKTDFGYMTERAIDSIENDSESGISLLQKVLLIVIVFQDGSKMLGYKTGHVKFIENVYTCQKCVRFRVNTIP
jgi:hypothetical protein